MCDLSDNGKLHNLLELKYKEKGVSLKKEILAFGVMTREIGI